MINRFDRPTLRTLRVAIEDLLREGMQVEGVRFKVGKATYSDKLATFKLELALEDETGRPMNEHRQAFVQLHHQFGFEPDDLDREFTYGGRPARLEGIAPRRVKNPIVLEINGQLKVAPAAHVLRALNRTVPDWLNI